MTTEDSMPSDRDWLLGEAQLVMLIMTVCRVIRSETADFNEYNELHKALSDWIDGRPWRYRQN